MNSEDRGLSAEGNKEPVGWLVWPPAVYAHNATSGRERSDPIYIVDQDGSNVRQVAGSVDPRLSGRSQKSVIPKHRDHYAIYFVDVDGPTSAA